MRKYFILLLYISIMLGCQPAEVNMQEYRGVWITNVDSEVLFSKESIVKAIDYLADRGFNIVFPVVWNKGYTLYPSQVMVDYFGEEYRMDPLFIKQGRDPLAEFIVEAHRRGIEVMPWFEFGFSSSYQENGGHLLRMKPQWAAKDSNGKLLTKNGFEWMNAIHPEVQDFMLALIREVIENYDVDGIQGDDRLPAMPSEGGYDDYTRKLYKQEMGTDVPASSREKHFLQWKADKLSDFGGRLYSMVKQIDADQMVSLSPSVYGWSKEEYLQDYPEWIRRNQVDILHPQAYRYDIARYKTTADDVAYYSGLMPDSAGNRYVDPGNVFVSPGILIKAGPRYNGPDYVLEAVNHNRAIGLHGEIYFFYEGLHHANQHLADSLFKYFYNVPAGLPHRLSPNWRIGGLISDVDESLRIPSDGNYQVFALLPFGQHHKKILSANAKVSSGWISRYNVPLYREIDSEGGWEYLGLMSLKAGDRILLGDVSGLPASQFLFLINRKKH